MKSLFLYFLFLLATCCRSNALVDNEKRLKDVLQQTHMHPPPSIAEKSFRPKREYKKIHSNSYESTSNFWRAEAQKKLRLQLNKKTNTNVAKNLILFLGDGMSISTITAARIYFGQKTGYSGEENLLSFEEFPYLGLSKVN